MRECDKRVVGQLARALVASTTLVVGRASWPPHRPADRSWREGRSSGSNARADRWRRPSGPPRPSGTPSYVLEDLIANVFYFQVTYRQADITHMALPPLVTLSVCAWFPEKELASGTLLPEGHIALPLDGDAMKALPAYDIIREAIAEEGHDAAHICI